MTYEYKCSCGKHTEINLSMKEDIPKTISCEKCNKDMKRLFQATPYTPIRQRAV